MLIVVIKRWTGCEYLESIYLSHSLLHWQPCKWSKVTRPGPLYFCLNTKFGKIPIVLENMTNTVETKLSDFVCSYLWFLAISLMKEDASHQRVHTPDLQKWDGWHAEILNNLWLEKWECCVSRVVQIPRPTRCHIMVCTYFSHELTNTVLSLQIPCKLGESKHEK